jgi:ribosomal-protein-alanine N-acetyltransferase
LPHPYTTDHAQAWLNVALKEERDLFWAITLNDQVIGGLGLRRARWAHEGTGVVGYWLGHAHRQRGIVPACLEIASQYALADGGLHRLEAGVYSSNPASMRVLEKAGFVREAVLKQRIIYAGDVLDEIIYARYRQL